MKKNWRNSIFLAAAFTLTACGNMSTHDIEAISHPGYCKNDSGQNLTTYQCNEKLVKDTQTGDKRSESDRMIHNINEDLKKEKTQ